MLMQGGEQILPSRASREAAESYSAYNRYAAQSVQKSPPPLEVISGGYSPSGSAKVEVHLMLNEWMAGRKITITSAYGGTGTVDPARLTKQTGLVDMRQEFHLLGEVDEPDGKTVQVQVQNSDVMEEYELNQVSVWRRRENSSGQKLPSVMSLTRRTSTIC